MMQENNLKRGIGWTLQISQNSGAEVDSASFWGDESVKKEKESANSSGAVSNSSVYKVAYHGCLLL